MTLKPVARCGAAAAAAVLAAVALSACGAGQLSQTASQVAAVDGAKGQNEAGTLLVRDVTVTVQRDDPMAILKFTAINNDFNHTKHTLTGVSVAGHEVTIPDSPELDAQCSLVSDTKDQLELMTKADNACVYYTTAGLENIGFPPGGNVPVTFTFTPGGTVSVDATISDTLLPAGQVTRTDVPAPDAHGEYHVTETSEVKEQPWETSTVSGHSSAHSGGHDHGNSHSEPTSE